MAQWSCIVLLLCTILISLLGIVEAVPFNDISTTNGIDNTTNISAFECLKDLTHCTNGLTCCKFKCVDTSNDPFNCGTCFNHCPDNQKCIGGQCECLTTTTTTTTSTSTTTSTVIATATAGACFCCVPQDNLPFRLDGRCDIITTSGNCAFEPPGRQNRICCDSTIATPRCSSVP